MENNPTPPITPRAAAERIVELAEKARESYEYQEDGIFAEAGRLAPILAREWLAEHTRLVWREVCVAHDLDDCIIYQTKLGSCPPRARRGDSIYNLLSIARRDGIELWIACHAETLEPWPIGLLEVEG